MLKLIFLLSLNLLVACGDSHIVNDPDSNRNYVDAGCKLYFKSEDLCLKMEWEVMPTDSTLGSMLLTFTDRKNRDVTVTPKHEPFVVLWMTSMGHGSTPVTMEYLDTGKYRVNEVFFIMPGPWDIKYQLKDSEAVLEEVIQPINV